jgi:hypothetical protein
MGDPSAPGRTLLTVYKDFVTEYATRNSLLSQTVWGRVLQRVGPGSPDYKVSNTAAFKELIGSDENVEHVLRLTNGNPEATRALREGFLDFYRNTVKLSPGGKIDMVEHTAFMREYGDTVTKIFGSDSKGFIRTVGGMGKALEVAKSRAARIVERINKSFDAEVTNLDSPGALMNMIWNPKNPEWSRRMVAMLGSDSVGREALKGIQSEVRKRIAHIVAGEFKDGKRILNFKKLQDLLQGRSGTGELGHRGIIENVMGKQYADDMVTLTKALEFSQRATAMPASSNSPFWTETIKVVARAYLGLFTRPGRLLTAGDRVRQRVTNNMLVQAIMDPETLRKLISLKGVDIRTQKAAAFMGSMGATILLSDDDAE